MPILYNASLLNRTLNNSETKLGKFINGNAFISTNNHSIDVDVFCVLFSYYEETGINLLQDYNTLVIAFDNLSMFSYPDDVTVQSIPTLKDKLTKTIHSFDVVFGKDSILEMLNQLDIVIDSEYEKLINTCEVETKCEHVFSKPQKTYLMTDSNTGYTKIGKSINPQSRETTLQSEKPTITLIATCDEDIEEELHDIFSDSRIRGEWFDLSDTEIECIIDAKSFKIIQ